PRKVGNNGIQEVVGSTPIGSPKILNRLWLTDRSADSSIVTAFLTDPGFFFDSLSDIFRCSRTVWQPQKSVRHKQARCSDDGCSVRWEKRTCNYSFNFSILLRNEKPRLSRWLPPGHLH